MTNRVDKTHIQISQFRDIPRRNNKDTKKMKIDKSPGPDKIPKYHRILKELAETISKPLTIIFNQSLIKNSTKKLEGSIDKCNFQKRKKMCSWKLQPSQFGISCL